MKQNGFINGIIAAILVTLPIGSVYAFSMFASRLAEACCCSLSQMQIAFSLSIFFLGMGAAFFGPIVERSPQKAAAIAALMYLSGMLLTAFGIHQQSFWLVLFGYGALNGLGQGIGYLSPVKALMLWFPKHKGLAASVSIVSFGLGSTLCTAVADASSKSLSLCQTFVLLAGIYFVMMTIGALLLRKPHDDTHMNISASSTFSYKKLFFDKMFWHSWLFMFLNISAGLALIGCSTDIFKDASIPSNIIVVLMMLAGVFNGAFRLVFAWASDFLKTRIDIWLIISGLSIVFLLFSGFYYPMIAVAVLLINACYGGGFSTCPAILSDYYDSNSLSRTHGAVLSAWAFAGLVGNNFAMAVKSAAGGFYLLIWALIVIYGINIFNVWLSRKVFVSKNRHID